MVLIIMRLYRFILVIFCCCHGAFTSAQIVNIERARMQSDTTGWMGSTGASFSLSKNTKQLFSTEFDVHLQYKSEKSLYLILANYGFLKSSGSKLIDNTFLHLRYNYKLNSFLRWEVFTQLQQNTITGIQSRFLIGSGPRFKVFSSKKFRLYMASLIMYEREKETIATNLLHNDFRSSSYVSFTLSPSKELELISTTFFQPLLNNWKDHRILNQVSLRVKAGKKIAMKVNWNYLTDSYPVKGVPSVNYTLSSVFDYSF